MRAPDGDPNIQAKERAMPSPIGRPSKNARQSQSCQEKIKGKNKCYLCTCRKLTTKILFATAVPTDAFCDFVETKPITAAVDGGMFCIFLPRDGRGFSAEAMYIAAYFVSHGIAAVDWVMYYRHCEPSVTCVCACICAPLHPFSCCFGVYYLLCSCQQLQTPVILPAHAQSPHLVGDHENRAAHARLHRPAYVNRYHLAHQVGPLGLELERVHATKVVSDQNDGLPIPHPLHCPLNPLHHLLSRVTPLLHSGIVAAKAGQVCRDAPEPIFQMSNLHYIYAHKHAGVIGRRKKQ